MAKNLILDLGGVILDIDFKLTHLAFEAAGVSGFDQLYGQHKAAPFFVDFEKGKIPTAQFFDHIREICGCPLSDETIRDCWNALVIGFDPAKVNWLFEMADRYNLFLFSNTNIVHYQCFAPLFYQQWQRDFNTIFQKAYYSHEMGLRKPAADSFQFILNEQQLDPADTIFVDDTIANVNAAGELGMQAIFLEKPKTVLELGL